MTNNAGLGEPLLAAQGEGEHDFSVQLFMAQLFVAPLAGLLGGFAGALLVVGVSSLLGLTRASNDIATHVGFGLTGFLLGYRLQMKYPGFYWSGGRWVWVPLALLFSYGVFTDGLMGWFFSDPKYKGDAIATILLTEPTIATCMYSVGVVIARRRTDRRVAVDARFR